MAADDQSEQRKLGAELAHQHAVRALDQQAGVLDNLRVRTGTVVAISALVATFLGGRALVDADRAPESIDWAALAPLTAFALGTYWAVRVLQPTVTPDPSKPRAEQVALRFSIDANGVLDAAADPDADPVYAEVARSAQDMWRRNVPIVEAKLADFNRATWALLAQVALWIGLLIWKGVV